MHLQPLGSTVPIEDEDEDEDDDEDDYEVSAVSGSSSLPLRGFAPVARKANDRLFRFFLAFRL
jgi:hypothetical protein